MSGEKNWLIRTTKHQILGPISKDKLVEFLNKNALSQNDEVSSGNGYWFLIRERDLVEKYILGDIIQGFNPISEAPNVLTAHLQTEKTGTLNKVPGLNQSSPAPVAKAHDSDEIKLPDESDLEFPDMDDDHGGDDITLVLPKAPVDKEAHLYADTPEIHTGGNDVTDITLIGDKSDHSAPAKKVKDTKTGEEVLVPSDDDLAYPDMGMASSNDHEEEVLVPDSADLEYPDMEEEVKAEPSSGGYEIPSAELLVDIPEEEEEPIPEPVIELEKKRPAAATTPPPAQRVHSTRPTASSKKASVYEEEDEDDDEEEPAPVKTKKSKKKTASAGPVHTPRNDRYLFFVLFLLLVLTMGIFYYYRKILNKPLPIIGIGDVEAQVINTQLGPIKKKHF